MSETPEQKEAFDKVDEAVDEAGWREERKFARWSWPSLWGGRGWTTGWSFRRGLDPPPGGPGLRDALHEDDEQS